MNAQESTTLFNIAKLAHKHTLLSKREQMNASSIHTEISVLYFVMVKIHKQK